jgi:hypothetical protein
LFSDAVTGEPAAEAAGPACRHAADVEDFVYQLVDRD